MGKAACIIKQSSVNIKCNWLASCAAPGLNELLEGTLGALDEPHAAAVRQFLTTKQRVEGAGSNAKLDDLMALLQAATQVGGAVGWRYGTVAAVRIALRMALQCVGVWRCRCTAGGWGSLMLAGAPCRAEGCCRKG